MTSLSGSRQLERYLKKLLVFYGKTSKLLFIFYKDILEVFA